MLNKVMIIGRLGNDPELKYSAEGLARLRLRVAVTEAYKAKDGEKKEKTEWFTVQMFGKTAEIVGEYARKGRLMYFEGRQDTHEWEGKDGAKKVEVSLVASTFQFLGKREADDDGNADRKGGARDGRNEERSDRRDAKASANPRKDAPPSTRPAAAGGFEDDDIPF